MFCHGGLGQRRLARRQHPPGKGPPPGKGESASGGPCRPGVPVVSRTSVFITFLAIAGASLPRTAPRRMPHAAMCNVPRVNLSEQGYSE